MRACISDEWCVSLGEKRGPPAQSIVLTISRRCTFSQGFLEPPYQYRDYVNTACSSRYGTTPSGFVGDEFINNVGVYISKLPFAGFKTIDKYNHSTKRIGAPAAQFLGELTLLEPSWVGSETFKWGSTFGGEKTIAIWPEFRHVTVPAGSKLQVPADQISLSAQGTANETNFNLTHGPGIQEVYLLISIPSNIDPTTIGDDVDPIGLNVPDYYPRNAIVPLEGGGNDTFVLADAVIAKKESASEVRFGRIPYLGFNISAVFSAPVANDTGTDPLAAIRVNTEAIIDAALLDTSSQLALDVQTPLATSPEGPFTVIGFIYINTPELSGTAYGGIPFSSPKEGPINLTKLDYANWIVPA